MSVSQGQIVKSAIGAVIGAVPGAVFLFYAHGKAGFAPYVVLALGLFIGVALTLPGVSAGNVLRGTAGVIAAHNVAPRHREKVLDVFLNSGKPVEPDAPPPARFDEPPAS